MCPSPWRWRVRRLPTASRGQRSPRPSVSAPSTPSPYSALSTVPRHRREPLVAHLAISWANESRRATNATTRPTRLTTRAVTTSALGNGCGRRSSATTDVSTECCPGSPPCSVMGCSPRPTTRPAPTGDHGDGSPGPVPRSRPSSPAPMAEPWTPPSRGAAARRIDQRRGPAARGLAPGDEVAVDGQVGVAACCATCCGRLRCFTPGTARCRSGPRRR